MGWNKGETYKLKRAYGPMNDREAIFTLEAEEPKTLELSFPFEKTRGFVTVSKQDFSHYFTPAVSSIGECVWMPVGYKLRQKLKEEGILTLEEIALIHYRTNGVVTDVRLSTQKTPKRIYRAKCMPEDEFRLEDGITIAAAKAFADFYHEKVFKDTKRYFELSNFNKSVQYTKEGK